MFDLLRRRLSFNALLVLVAALIIARGIFVMCVLPPLEGWDEYQHVGYLQFIQEERRWPTLNEDLVPDSVMDALRTIPQPKHAVTQIGDGGAITYRQYWDGQLEPVEPAAPAPALYAAQHAPAYYTLVQPIWRLSGGVADLPFAIAVMRGLNLLMLAAAAILFALTLRKLCANPLLVTAAVALLALHPLYLLAGLRVSNDALAILLASAAFLALAHYFTIEAHDDRRRLRLMIITGVLIAAGIWAKSTNASLIPIAAFAIGYVHFRTRSKGAPTVKDLATVGISAGVLLFPLILHNQHTYGLSLVTCEALANRAGGVGMLDLARAMAEIPWVATIWRLWWSEALWTGGWSFVVPAWGFIAAWSVIGALLLLALALCCFTRSARQRIGMLTAEHPSAFALSLAAIACTTAAVAYHALQSYTLTYAVMSNAWYTAHAMPFALFLFVGLISVLPGSPLRLVTLATGAVMFATEVGSTAGRLATTCAGTGEFPENLYRVSTLQPPFLCTTTLCVALTATCLLAAPIALSLLPLPKPQLRARKRSEELVEVG